MADSKSRRYVSDPTDPIRAVLILYANRLIGAPWADQRITAILFKMGLASQRELHPMKVGIHRKSRGGVIAHSLEAPRLMGDIADDFWNEEQCAHAICAWKLHRGIPATKMLSATGVENQRLTSLQFSRAVSRLFRVLVRTPIAAYGRSFQVRG